MKNELKYKFEVRQNKDSIDIIKAGISNPSEKELENARKKSLIRLKEESVEKSSSEKKKKTDTEDSKKIETETEDSEKIDTDTEDSDQGIDADTEDSDQGIATDSEDTDHVKKIDLVERYILKPKIQILTKKKIY